MRYVARTVTKMGKGKQTLEKNEIKVIDSSMEFLMVQEKCKYFISVFGASNTFISAGKWVILVKNTSNPHNPCKMLVILTSHHKPQLINLDS